MSRTALIVVVLVTAGLFLAGCGQQEQGEDTETTEETAAEETAAEETTAGEITTEETTVGEATVEETTRQETTTAASDSEQVAEAEVEAAPPVQAAPLPSNEESQPSDGSTPSQGLGVNEAGQDVSGSNTPAISPTNSIVFFPGGNGITYSCAGGPPFVSNHDSMGMMGNCTVQQVGLPAGLICDVPTTITIVHDMHPFVADASICYSVTGDAGHPNPAQAYPPGTQLAPYPPAA